jgi:hypothetical protein
MGEDKIKEGIEGVNISPFCGKEEVGLGDVFCINSMYDTFEPKIVSEATLPLKFCIVISIKYGRVVYWTEIGMTKSKLGYRA